MTEAEFIAAHGPMPVDINVRDNGVTPWSMNVRVYFEGEDVRNRQMYPYRVNTMYNFIEVYNMGAPLEYGNFQTQRLYGKVAMYFNMFETEPQILKGGDVNGEEGKEGGESPGDVQGTEVQGHEGHEGLLN